MRRVISWVTRYAMTVTLFGVGMLGSAVVVDKYVPEFNQPVVQTGIWMGA